MRQEIVTDKETEKHEIIDQVLKIKLERQPQIFELQVKVLSDDRYLDKLELCDPRKPRLVFSVPQAALIRFVARLAALEALLLVWTHHNLAQDEEMRLMRGKTKHDQISVGTVDAMPRICIVALLCSL